MLGGVESIIAAQCRTLASLGLDVRLVTGDCASWPGAAATQIPLLDPRHPEVMRARGAARLPAASHPVVARLTDDLRRAVDGCSQVWVHNAFTVSLNPILTRALHVLASESGSHWVAWCEDLSSASIYARGPDISTLPYVEVVTISSERSRQLVSRFRLPVEPKVIEPPVDPVFWLGMSDRTVALCSELNLFGVQLLVLVPAKLLPHKNLALAVELARGLRSQLESVVVLLTGPASPHEPELSDRVRAGLDEQIARFSLQSHVRFLTDLVGEAPDLKIVRDLMMLADLVFIPSREEGFSLPLREAALLRVPVMCLDLPTFNEALGDSVHYVSASASGNDLAQVALDAAPERGNSRRRRILQSDVRFRRGIAGIVGLRID
ncbi:MAG: glycosyltransferase [Chloroflexota bacterium]